MKILIADDHALFRGGLKLQLLDFEPGSEVVEAVDFLTLLSVALAESPDMIIADLGMPGMPWREALSQVRANLPDTPLVVLSANDDDGNVREAIRLGANGFISKCDPPEVVMAALRLVRCGGSCVPPSFVRRGSMPLTTPQPESCVTHRQREVLRLIADGLSNKQIAYKLQLTEGTVKLHVAAILKSLGATNRTQAVAAARHAGLLETVTPG